MTDVAKQKYQKLSDQDKVRFEKETAMLASKGYFINKDGVKSTDIKPELKHFPKSTVMPKGKIRAQNCYMKAAQPQVKHDFPELPQADRFRKIFEQWAAMTPKEKMPYEQQALEDAKRYDNEVDQLRTHGFFVNADGVKSTDLKKKVSLEERKKIAEEKEKVKEKEKAQKLKEKERFDKDKAKEKALALAAKSKGQSQKAKVEQLKQKAVEKAGSIHAIDGYKLFVKTKYPDIFKKLVEQNGKANHAEVMKIVGNNWNSMTTGTQRKYELKAIQAAEEEKTVAAAPKTKKRAKPDTPVESEAQVKAKNSNKRVKKA